MPTTRARRPHTKLLKPLAVLVHTAALSCSSLSAATAAPVLPSASTAAAVAVTEAPVIYTTPSDNTVGAGEGVWFAASSSDAEAFQQWQVSTDGGGTFVDIAGANSTYLELAIVGYADNGSKYRAFFTNAEGTAYTDAATLTVTASRPNVTAGPESTSVKSGGQFTFRATAEADPAPSIQWQIRKEDGVARDIPGATSAPYTATAPTTAHSGWRFRAVFTNPDSSVNTAWATLTVTASKPAVVTNPVNVTVDAGKVATFTAKATADPAPRAQWQVKRPGTSAFEVIAGATGNTYSFKPTKADTGSLFRARYANEAGAVTTTTASLTVHGTVPSAPRSMTAVQSGPGRVTVRWAAPASAGSVPITSYSVGYSAGQWGNGESVPASARSTVFRGLARGKYTFSVTAVNAAGPSVRASVPVSVR
jgi:hypothetical protein